MKPENEKYNKVLNLLRESKPMSGSTEDIEREVIKKIAKINRFGLNFSEVIDFLFGWVYIGWVRRSFIMVSVVLMGIFIYQQSILIKRIDMINTQTVVIDRENFTKSEEDMGKILMVYKNSGRKFPSKTIIMPERQMKELLDSVNELQIKYKDFENLIEGDPELKKFIEMKLIEYNRTKINL
jgi:hypothetical protein